MEYYKSDFYERLARGVAAMQGFRDSIQQARENPVYVSSGIQNGIAQMQQNMKLALELHCSVEVAEEARWCMKLLRRLKPLFTYLNDEIPLSREDEITNEYLRGMVDAEDDGQFLKTLLSTSAFPPERLARFLERQKFYVSASTAKPVEHTWAIRKLRTLREKIAEQD